MYTYSYAMMLQLVILFKTASKLILDNLFIKDKL